MKRIALFIVLALGISTITLAQTNDNYADLWKKVSTYEEKGLTKAAIREVNSIYQKAVKEKNDPQLIKSAMYLIKYKDMVEENSTEKNIFFIDSLANKTKAPAKNILQSIEAEMYLNFLQTNRWKLYNRTKLEEEKTEDINTWSIDKLTNVISSLYKSSLQNAGVLKTTKIDTYDPILIKGENTRQLRPTLYDFLAH